MWWLAGPGDSITNMIVAGFISSGLFLSSYNIYCLMGNGKKMEGYCHLHPTPLQLDLHP